ncbi:MAG: hypothetical protein PARBA_03821 [Parabacteroides sp.]
MELPELFFCGSTVCQDTCFHIVSKWGEIGIRYRITIYRINQFHLVGYAIKADKQPFLKFQKCCSGCIVRARRKVEFLCSCRKCRTVLTIGESFAEGIGIPFRFCSEYIYIECSDFVFRFGSNGSICLRCGFSLRLGCLDCEFVFKGKQYLTSVSVIRFIRRCTVCFVRFCRAGSKQHSNKQIYACSKCLCRSVRGTWSL